MSGGDVTELSDDVFILVSSAFQDGATSYLMRMAFGGP
jgi:hypothetical protein